MTSKPSRFYATPAQIDAFLREHFAEDVLLHFYRSAGDEILDEALTRGKEYRARQEMQQAKHVYLAGMADVMEAIWDYRFYPAKLPDMTGYTRPHMAPPKTGSEGPAEEIDWTPCSPEWLATHPGQCGTALRKPGGRYFSHLHPATLEVPADTGAAPAVVDWGRFRAATAEKTRQAGQEPIKVAIRRVAGGVAALEDGDPQKVIAIARTGTGLLAKLAAYPLPVEPLSEPREPQEPAPVPAQAPAAESAPCFIKKAHEEHVWLRGRRKVQCPGVG